MRASKTLPTVSRKIPRRKFSNYVVISKQSAKKLEGHVQEALRNGSLVLILPKSSKNYKILKFMYVNRQKMADRTHLHQFIRNINISVNHVSKWVPDYHSLGQIEQNEHSRDDVCTSLQETVSYSRKNKTFSSSTPPPRVNRIVTFGGK
ncbi:uncharacterized protein LOC114879322 [Osmia bicornis bicornis]|uniref:uncharacterized protein LOC114879322 n=1 Tax=Osmia bicornis bicornis TaxID=1437191 RepID=UPI001EAF0D93|nr:uncharacterized protein LOC114879322 [Osmia bicornis bicornis]